MRRILFTFVLTIGIALPLAAQQNPPYPTHQQGNVTVQDTGTCSKTSAFVKFNGKGNASVGIQISGTWTGTLSFFGSLDGVNWNALNATPLNATTPVSTTTGNGAWLTAAPGGAWVCVDATAAWTGTALVGITTTLGLAGAGGPAGGGGGGSVTSVSVVGANGLGGSVATATTTPAITLTTSVNGLAKGNGTGFSAAVSGADYAPATSGSTLLGGNGAGGFTPYAGASSCAAGTFFTALSAAGASTCTTATGEYLGYQLITTTGACTYTPTAGTNSIILWLQGGGGGGGGVASPTSTNVAVAGGGGGGAFIQVKLSTGIASASGCSVGTGGTGGTAGANPGQAGGDTTLTVNTVTYTAHGGAAGAAGAASAAPQLFRGSFGGSAVNGDLNISGGFSGITICTDGSHCVSGRGGASHLSTGGPEASIAAANSAAAGLSGNGYGGGGSGACAAGTGSASAGGNGSAGVIVIYEFR